MRRAGSLLGRSGPACHTSVKRESTIVSIVFDLADTVGEKVPLCAREVGRLDAFDLLR